MNTPSNTSVSASGRIRIEAVLLAEEKISPLSTTVAAVPTGSGWDFLGISHGMRGGA